MISAAQSVRSNDSCESPPSPVCPSQSHRFTLDGSEGLETHLERTCQRLLAGVRAGVPGARLEGLALGGGYGRGEGGVFKTPSGDLPYNDLEFYICIRGNQFLNERFYREAWHELSGQLSPEAGLELEFKVLSLSKLRRSPVTMHLYDFVTAHYWLQGDDSLLNGCERHGDAANIPMSEATRLLMNRCTGLLFAADRLRREPFTPDDADFVRRNLAKADLALGDAMLTVFGHYHWSCRERHQRLLRLPLDVPSGWLNELRRRHAQGLEFKLHPSPSGSSRQMLADQLEELRAFAEDIWLWVEGVRLGRVFDSARDYSLSSRNKSPETACLVNLLRNLAVWGAGAVYHGHLMRHPRERILRALALLLWEPAALRDSRLRRRVQTDLQTSQDSLPGLVQSYRRIWERVR